MKRIRSHLTYANVMSTLALFLALTGATAFAATQLGKNTVGTKQLKKNAVTTAKIKKNAVSRAKIRKNAINTARLKKNAVTTAKLRKNAVTAAKLEAGAVTGAKLGTNAVTGDKIDAASTPFSRVTARLRSSQSVPFGGKTPVLLGTYTQPAGELDQYVGELTVTFAPACTAPRSAVAYLVVDPPDPNNPSPTAIAGVAVSGDESGASSVHKASFIPFFEGAAGMQSFESATARTHSVYAYAIQESCKAGSGVTASDFALDVIGTK